MATEFDYFLTYYRDEIRKGNVRQIDLSRASDRPPQFWNRLFKGNPQSCPVEDMQIFAKHLNISFEEMIRRGKNLYSNNNDISKDEGMILENHVVNIDNADKNGIVDPVEQEEILRRVATGIVVNSQKLKECEEKSNIIQNLTTENNILKRIFEQLDEGVTFFDSERNFVYSSNVWGLLNGLDISKKPSIENIIVQLNERIENIKPVLKTIFSVAEKPPEGIREIDVKIVNGPIFHFKIVPVFSDDKTEFLGTLLINTPVRE